MLVLFFLVYYINVGVYHISMFLILLIDCLVKYDTDTLSMCVNLISNVYMKSWLWNFLLVLLVCGWCIAVYIKGFNSALFWFMTFNVSPKLFLPQISILPTHGPLHFSSMLANIEPYIINSVFLEVICYNHNSRLKICIVWYVILLIGFGFRILFFMSSSIKGALWFVPLI